MAEGREKGGPGPTGTDVAVRFRLASPATATVLGVLAVILMAVGIALSVPVHQGSVLSTGPVVPIVVIYAGVGFIVARRQPRNPIGWILIGFILVFVFSSIAGWYAVLYYRFGHHGLPLPAVAVVLQPSWAPALLLFPVAILLFPDGRLASRRWRRLLQVYAVAGALASAAIFSPAVTAVARHDVRLDAFGDVVSSGKSHGGPLAIAEVLGLVVILVIWLSFVAHQVLSWRRASGERRQQLKWLASGAGVTVAVIAVSFGINSTSVAGEVLGIGLAALPVGIGVGILKYRLYDIDRIISRTLAYAIVTGMLVGVYAGLVLLATQVLMFHSTVAVAASTLAAAALFNPLRRRVQHAVDRRFNRARYDADEAVAAFAARLKDAVDLDSVRGDLTGVVQQALEPAHLSIWVSRRD
jgi:MFS family permease